MPVHHAAGQPLRTLILHCVSCAGQFTSFDQKQQRRADKYQQGAGQIGTADGRVVQTSKMREGQISTHREQGDQNQEKAGQVRNSGDCGRSEVFALF